MNLRIFPSMLVTVSLLGPLLFGGTDYESDRKQWEHLAETAYAWPNTGSATSMKTVGVSRSTIDPRPRGIFAQPLKVKPMQYNLGIMYLNGRGVARDAKEASAWFRKAADAGDKLAQCNLGALYEQGLGVTQDSSQALKWFLASASMAIPWPNTISE